MNALIKNIPEICMLVLMFPLLVSSCNRPEYEKGSFGHDLAFLSKHMKPIVLKNETGKAQLIVSPEYQGKVFTSTARGNEGLSFGWINYEAVSSDRIEDHINLYGGEDRLWLGPEGGQFSIFFEPGAEMVFENWQTPPAIDTEKWELVSRMDRSVLMKKDMQLASYSGTTFELELARMVSILEKVEIEKILGLSFDDSIDYVGYETNNKLRNTGEKAWTRENGTLCMWNLGMFNTSPGVTVVIPFHPGDSGELGPVATTNYFGEIGPERFRIADSLAFFRVDGKQRRKLGLSPLRAKTTAGSYDEAQQVLTLVNFSIADKDAAYINQLWEMQEEPFKGDVFNSYNDGPLEDGSQLGPFYELESSSPAAFLAPGAHLTHIHRVFHFTGPEEKLDRIARQALGISVAEIKEVF